MSTKEKFALDLKRSGQVGMADWLLNMSDPELEKQLETIWKYMRQFVICKTCGKVYVDMPYKDYYKAHTFPEWDIWFCDAVLHWAETEGGHSIYCFTKERNYDISSSLTKDCCKSSWPQIHKDMKDVVKMREGFMKRKDKLKNWVVTTSELKGEQ